MVGQITNELYALPMKKCLKNSEEQINKDSPEEGWRNQNKLPPGWERHEGI